MVVLVRLDRVLLLLVLLTLLMLLLLMSMLFTDPLAKVRSL